MKTRHFFSIILNVSLIHFAIQGAQATPELEKEIGHLSRGDLSRRFILNIQEGLDEATKKTIASLEKQASKIPYEDQVIKLRPIQKSWIDLSQKENVDPKFRLLCAFYAHTLNPIYGPVANELATQCHSFVQGLEGSESLKARIAYQGLQALRVEFKKHEYDMLNLAPQLTPLLEDLKVSTASMKTVADFGSTPHPQYFPQSCIPQAHVCEYFVKLYRTCGVNPQKFGNTSAKLRENGEQALQIYLSGLENSPTPDQKKYYHKAVWRLASWIHESLEHDQASEEEKDRYKKVAETHALEVAKIFKDQFSETEKVRKFYVLEQEECEQEKRESFMLSYSLAIKTAKWYSSANQFTEAHHYITALPATPPSFVYDFDKLKRHRDYLMKRIMNKLQENGTKDRTSN